MLGRTGRVEKVKKQSTFSKVLSTVAGIVGGVGVSGIVAAAWGMSETRKFELKEITLPILKPGTLKNASEFRILHVSDLHMVASQTKKQEWVAHLDRLEPDLVINTGDNLSDPKGVPGVMRALNPLLRRPGLFVFGTNDYFGPRPVNPFLYLFGKKRKPSEVELPWKGMRAAFIEHGWVDMTHKRHEFQVNGLKIAAAGVDDPHHDLDDYSTVAGAPNEAADIALALVHSPEPRVLAQFEQDGYHLSFSGHTHGGQLCLPGSKAIVTNCGIDRARVQGLNDFGAMKMHVSNGLGQSRYVPIRLFCRPSATLITLVEKS